jgi:CheY-like chemotaxis protein
MSEPPSILFVDDELAPGRATPDRHYMWYYSLALREAGYRVIEVNTPDDALREATTTSSIRLIILDVMMKPGRGMADCDTEEGRRTGLELARQLRKLGVHAPIVALTQHHRTDILNEFSRLSHCHVMFKDAFTPGMLADEVSSILNIS